MNHHCSLNKSGGGTSSMGIETTIDKIHLKPTFHFALLFIFPSRHLKWSFILPQMQTRKCKVANRAKGMENFHPFTFSFVFLVFHRPTNLTQKTTTFIITHFPILRFIYITANIKIGKMC
jgi:hypothetical protein